MDKIKIAVLAKKVLDEIYATNRTKKRKDALRTLGVKPIVKHFEEKALDYYDKTVINDFVTEIYRKYCSGKIDKSKWQIIRRCCAFMEQIVINGHISLEPVRKWSIESTGLFNEPLSEQRSNLENIHTLVYLTHQAMMKLDLSDKTKSNYTSDGFADVLRFFVAENEIQYSVELLENFVNEAYRKYRNNEICRSKYHNICKITTWIKEYHDTQTITQKNRTPKSFEYAAPKFEALIEEYISCSANEKLLKNSTIAVYSCAVRRFFREMKSKNITEYAQIKLKDVSDCISSVAKHGSGNVATVLNAMKSFTDFIREKHPDFPDIAPALLGKPAKHRKIYRGYTEEEIERILIQVDKSTAKGKRDYALLMIARYTGLRGIDIVSLTFENIDWQKSEIRIVQAKTGIPLVLPLNVSVGNAIAQYILEARPQSECRKIFLRMQRPYTGLSSRSLWSVFCQYAFLVVEKGNELRHGPHAFRRGIGTRMLEAGVSHFVISDVLGHSSSSSLLRYTAVSVNNLRQCSDTLESIPVMQEELL